MIQVLTFPEEFIQETGNTPAVCLVLPFEPQINDKSSIECRLKAMIQKAESRLLQQYSYRKALPVLARIQELASKILYHNYKKSLALLATAYRSNLYYLDFQVLETIRTGEDLDIRNVIKAKNERSHYLVLVLGNGTAELYEGNPSRITLIKHNVQSNNCFLHQVDQGLGLMLEACRLPVFVVGEQSLLEAFKKETAQAEQIMAYLSIEPPPANEKDIISILQPELNNWRQHQYKLLLQKLSKGKQEGTLNCGMESVWQAATHRRSSLLVVEENLMRIVPREKDASQKEEEIHAWPIIDPLNHQDLVNDAIEKVLHDGGEVEFVPSGFLAQYQQIALIEAHHPH